MTGKAPFSPWINPQVIAQTLTMFWVLDRMKTNNKKLIYFATGIHLLLAMVQSYFY
jgi:hypothetical protein